MTDNPRLSNRKRLLHVAFGVAVILYGLAGFPTPDEPEPEQAAAQQSCPSGHHIHDSNPTCHTHSVGCSTGEHKHGGLGCHSRLTSHSSCAAGHHSHSSNPTCHTHSVGCSAGEHKHGSYGC